MRRPAALCLIAAGSVAWLVGCNTDRLWEAARDRQIPRPQRSKQDLPDIQVAETQEVDLVEQVLYHRKHYRQALTDLRDFYIDRGSYTKRKWAEYELADLGKVKPFKYILDAEIPASSLHASDSIAEADALYRRGLDLMERGGHGVPVLYREDLMRQALGVFTELISKYPTSDKIDDAAFCMGEIYKEYYKDQEPLAVKWYQRAYTWDPRTPQPARFQAAVVYDFRLHDRAKALELYHDVLKSEANNRSNSAFASRRIAELTEGIRQIHTPRPPTQIRTTSTGSPGMFGTEDQSAGAGDNRSFNPVSPVSTDEMDALRPSPPRRARPTPVRQPAPRPRTAPPPQPRTASPPQPRAARPPQRDAHPASTQLQASQPTFDALNAQRASKGDLVPIVNLGPDD